MTMLAVFRSRTQALDALGRIGSAGVSAQVVATPKEAGYGCGLSVRFDGRNLPIVSAVLRRRAYASFAGYLRACNGGYVKV